VTGYVEDIRPWVHRAACFVVPIRVGGGTRLKILDAWALGKAVVSTSPGSEGLAVKQGKNMLVEDDPQAFARAVLRVLDSEALRERLEKEGRRTAVEKYDWDVVGRSMLSAYSDLLRGTVSEGPQSDR
jgi:glycosyltransferase involved in cell wall biosynthesis